MSRARSFAVAFLLLLLAACASTPPSPPPPFVVKLAPTLPVGIDAPLPLQPVRVEDAREVVDRTRIGEVHAPVAVAPVGAGTREGAAASTALVLLALAAPAPTGRYLVIADSSDVARAVEYALNDALLRAHRTPIGRDRVHATVRQFWIRPSWTTRCDIVLDVRVLGPGGQVRWERTLESHVDRFEGWFTVEAFERVATLGLDELVAQAAEAFGSTAFGAALVEER